MNIPVSNIDFYSDAVIQDPYPVYAQLREMGPVVYLQQNNLYAVSRYEQVSEVLRQPLRYVSSRGLSPLQKVNDIIVGSTLNSDPPEHDRTRAITSEPLLPGALKAIEPKIKSAADGLIDMLCARGEFDAISDLAQFLPLSIVVELVGLPDEAGAEKMLKWASAAFNLFSTENARTDQAFVDLTELRDFLLEYGRPEKLKDGGWAKRIFEVGPTRGFSNETCAQLMRDYIAPSLDTTISTTGQIIKFFADEPEQWNKIREDGSLIPNAVEEAVRLATPIRAFTRYVIENSEIAGQSIPEGERILVIYASANRDERKFPNADAFDVTRDVHDHVGFGQGVHMCLGMHLARREIILLLEALRRRVERFELTDKPTISMNNTIRAYSSMPVRIQVATDILADDTIQVMENSSPWLDVVISNRQDKATDIIGLEIRSADNQPLPAFEAGSHVDVEIQSGLIRQYSLCGNPDNTSCYQLGVLKDANSRGGSIAIHEQFQLGRKFRIGRPRNNFPLNETSSHTILFAGGVGITPVLCMARVLHNSGQSWEMHYCARSADRLAFRNELSRFGENVKTYTDTSPPAERLNTKSVLENAVANTHIYVCGPNGFMDYVVGEAEALAWPASNIHLERFGAEIDTDGAAFSVVAKRSDIEIEVKPGETIANKLRESGIDVQVSCQSGVCGTCLTRVVEGKPDHRDLVQTDAEKATNEQVTVCCSRSKTKKLVLDI